MLLTTPRLALREYEPDDITTLFELDTEPEAERMRGLDDRQMTLLEYQFWFSTMLAAQHVQPRTLYPFVITLKESGEIIGRCRLKIIDMQRKEAELGYFLKRSVWGQGYATEAAQALVRLGFEQLYLARIIAKCHINNGASRRVMEKIGMQQESESREPDIITCSITKARGLPFSE